MSFQGKILEFENGLIVGGEGSVRGPSEYKVGFHDTDKNSKRSETGFLNRNRIRQNQLEVKISWQGLSWDEVRALAQAGKAAKFQLTLLDPEAENGNYSTGWFYREADREYTLVRIFSSEEATWTYSVVYVEF